MKKSHFLITPVFFLLASASFSQQFPAVSEDDFRCLQSINDDLQINLNWNFHNSTVGFVCFFTGVSCWNFQENRVQAITLSDLSLSGQLPSALQYCSSLTSLDLSRNSLSGSIPDDICAWLPNLVTLDLSDNHLTGHVPSKLSGCLYLNNLNLAGNKLSGDIPLSITQLDRLVKLDLSDNQLSGQVPEPLVTKFGLSSFEGNSGLCGLSFSPNCGKQPMGKKSLITIIAAGVAGAVFSLVLAFTLWWFCFGRACHKYYSTLFATVARLMSYKRTTVIIMVVFGVVGGCIGLAISIRRWK